MDIGAKIALTGVLLVIVGPLFLLDGVMEKKHRVEGSCSTMTLWGITICWGIGLPMIFIGLLLSIWF